MSKEIKLKEKCNEIACGMIKESVSFLNESSEIEIVEVISGLVEDKFVGFNFGNPFNQKQVFFIKLSPKK